MTREYAAIAPGTEFVLPACSWQKTGFVFDSWIINGETLGSGEKITVSADVKAVAVWKTDPDYVPVKAMYTVSFKDGYSDGIESFEVDEDAAGAYTLPDLFEEFLRTDDKLFVGWRMEGSDEILLPDEIVAIYKSTAFTAMWEDAVYKLTFADGDQTVYENAYASGSVVNAPAAPVTFNGFSIGSYTLYHNESDCASTNELNNVSFPEGEPEYVGVDNVFSLKVQVPEGYVPVLLLEYAARLEEGYFRYNAVSVENNAYLFEVSGIDSEIGWAVELVADEYEIVFIAGDTVTVLTLAYGTQFDTAPGVPAEYVSGGTVYTVTGWKNLAGETVFGADGKSNVLIAEGVAKG